MDDATLSAAGSSAEGKASRRRRRLRRWLPWGIVIFLFLYLAIVGVSALIAKNALESVIPVAGDVQDAVASGDTEAARARVDEVAANTGTARAATDHVFWRGLEWLPVVGDDIRSVRLAAAAGDDLVRDALTPFASVDITAIGPVDGALNLDAVRGLAEPMAQAAAATERVQIDLSEIDASTLLPPVQSQIGRVTEAVEALWPTLNRLAELMPHLPTMLGGDGPRNYIVMVQNNAEARSTGGNPASLMVLTADQGRIAITQQASSTDFNNARETPVAGLSESTATLYGDRVGRWIQDTTMAPDFRETANLVRAFWQDSYGTPPAGVLSLDPVALGYMLKATGPVGLPGGGQLTTENAAKTLLHDVYFQYPGDTFAERRAQDLFFGTAAGGVFDKITSGDANLVQLVQALAKASDEGRLLYASTDPTEMGVVDGTTFVGPLPVDNDDQTALGVFVNDTTEGKLDYYSRLSVTASSDVCTVSDEEEPTFTAKAKYDYTLKPGDVAGLPYYISTGRYYPKGVKATDMVFYGPLGAKWASATLDGQPVQPHVGTDDQGRPAVRIRIENQPATSHTLEVTFTGAAGQEYGPLDVVHTPMMKDVPVELSTPGCQ
ncbi:DUF4012 domain-containing protein [Microbacterium paludicola]|uniref:DUF4012 domain-containing protein n=1 Tax=Microbacterium paludicola TaxID=300019 RepID=UPI0031D07BCF